MLLYETMRKMENIKLNVNNRERQVFILGCIMSLLNILYYPFKRIKGTMGFLLVIWDVSSSATNGPTFSSNVTTF